MSVTVDANILVYASNRDDSAHDAANRLMNRLGEGPELVCLFWPAIMGYLRIATNPSIIRRPLAFSDAVANVAAFLERPHVRTETETDDFCRLLKSFSDDHPRGNDVPDTHLAALMRLHGVTTIYTRDRGFRRFDGITAVDPFSER